MKTHRNRAFARLDIHFRSQLFALVQGLREPDAACGAARERGQAAQQARCRRWKLRLK